MSTNLSELIAALPQDSAEATAEFSREQLERIFADLAHRPVPVGSLHRLWTVSAGLKERRSAGFVVGEVGAPLAGTRYALYTRF
jgi:hypothetical protein